MLFHEHTVLPGVRNWLVEQKDSTLLISTLTTPTSLLRVGILYSSRLILLYSLLFRGQTNCRHRLVPRPHPTFHHLLYCKRGKAGQGPGNEATVENHHVHTGTSSHIDIRTQCRPTY